jgi:putative molybdopterin biosynthesis protein
VKLSRSIYIENKPIEEALQLFYERLGPYRRIKEVKTAEALFHITAAPIFARMSSPHFHCAAMDGIVIRAQETFGVTEQHPKVFVEGKDFEYINTGNPLPNNFDAVVMIEDVEVVGEASDTLPHPHTIMLRQGAHPWQHIRLVGEDIIQGEMILPSGHQIRPLDLGALLCAGIETIKIFEPYQVGIIPTGSEIVNDIKALQYGKIMDSNSFVFEGYVKTYGHQCLRYDPVEDDPIRLEEAIRKGIEENDILLVNAGSSAGGKDYTKDIIAHCGEVIVHGVAMKPGKPTILGIIQGKPVIGLPGYPVSAFFAFETFVKPLLVYQDLEQVASSQNTVMAILNQRVVSSLKHEEKIRITLGQIDERLIATPLSRGAGATMSLVKADGILTLPRQWEGIESQTQVKIQLLKNLEDIVHRLVITGSHDMILDCLGEKLPLVSAHVGSLGGVFALKKMECHLAPVHLIHEATGIYNDHLVNQFFPEEEMALIHVVKRTQGLYVQKGNPKNMHSLHDLIRPEVTMMNRQRGSGTRQLLDYQLKLSEITCDHIKGYDREMTTHLGVAEAVRSKAVDCGLGVESAAKSMGLDFIPIGHEAYEFLTYKKYLQDERVTKLIQRLSNPDFKEEIEKLGGYDCSESGKVRNLLGKRV